MKSVADSNAAILRFAFNREDAADLATTPREKLVFEGLQGDLEIAADWTPESQRSDYKPVGNRLVARPVVIVPVLDELVEVCQQLDKRQADLPRVVLQGTPLELAFRLDGEIVVVSVVEAIGYSDTERVLGTVRLPIPRFFGVVSTIVRKVRRDILSANPSLHDSPVVRSLEQDSVSLDRRASGQRVHDGRLP